MVRHHTPILAEHAALLLARPPASIASNSASSKRSSDTPPTTRTKLSLDIEAVLDIGAARC